MAEGWGISPAGLSCQTSRVIPLCTIAKNNRFFFIIFHLLTEYDLNATVTASACFRSIVGYRSRSTEALCLDTAFFQSFLQQVLLYSLCSFLRQRPVYRVGTIIVGVPVDT